MQHIQNSGPFGPSLGKIPDNWKLVKLNDIIDSIQSGIWGEDPVNKIDTCPVIRSTDISHEGKVILTNIAQRQIPKEKISQFALKTGDILIVSSSGSPHLVGRTAFFQHPNNKTKYLFSNFLVMVRPSEAIDSKFLYYFLCSSTYRKFLEIPRDNIRIKKSI